MRLDDPEVVRRECSSEEGLRARTSVYAGAYGPDAVDVAFGAVRQAAPARVLEARHLARVERRDVPGTVTFATADDVRGDGAASVAHKQERNP